MIYFSRVPKTAEICREAILSHFFIILSQIELEKVIFRRNEFEKVILVRSEILVLLIKSVSDKTELEKLSQKKSFLVRSEILILLVKSVSNKTTRIFTVANNLQSFTKILKQLYKSPFLY